jgi:hypothetical protein
MSRYLIVVTAVIAVLLTPDPCQADTFSTVGTWTVHGAESSKQVFCYADSTFADGTNVTFGYDVRRESWMFIFGNNKWQTLRSRTKQIPLDVYLDKNGQMGFTSSNVVADINKNVAIPSFSFTTKTDSSSKFVQGWAVSNQVRIYSKDHTQIVKLSLADTYAVTIALAKCSSARRNSDTSDPFSGH